MKADLVFQHAMHPELAANLPGEPIVPHYACALVLVAVPEAQLERGAEHYEPSSDDDRLRVH